jgi:hypothetical protein
MNAMNMPGFSADASLYHTSEQYYSHQAYTAATESVVPQIKCPCPQGLLDKASRFCDNTERGERWCDILGACLDCYI